LHKKIKKIFIIILIFVLVVGIVKIVNTSSIKQLILKKMYPMTYSEYVYKYSEENNIDPLLTFAIIKAESNFNSKVVSSSNAMGLMQLMESTAEEIMQKDLQEEFNKDMLFNPEDNIKIGTAYFAKLIQRYGNIPLALTAYNAGIGKVDGWIEDCIIKEDGSDVENIPYKETNNYVRKILRDYKIYEHIYKEEK
jgi:soluble lytic murein transglycosylase